MGASPAPASSVARRPPVRERFALLFRVTIRHEYYNDGDNLCPDFRIRPTPDCAARMARLGLLFRDEGCGFSVHVAVGRIDALSGAVRRLGNADAECWPRLSFLAWTVNPDFFGITDLPFSVSPADDMFYFTNRSARRAAGTVALTPGPYVTWTPQYAVCRGEVSVTMPNGTARIEIRDMSGASVRARDIDPSAWGNAYPVDFSPLPFGMYEIRATGSAEAAGFAQTVLFAAGRPPPLCFFDMLLTRPKPDADGIYPLTDDHSGPGGGVHYELRFRARQTFWHYYVASRQDGAALSALRIAGDASAFDGPDPVRLPSGANAQRLQSRTALPLRRRSPYRFRLTGMRRDGEGLKTDIRVADLPSAPVSPVWPLSGENRRGDRKNGISEMFVYV